MLRREADARSFRQIAEADGIVAGNGKELFRRVKDPLPRLTVIEALAGEFAALDVDLSTSLGLLKRMFAIGRCKGANQR